jgi:hypothetical protein
VVAAGGMAPPFFSPACYLDRLVSVVLGAAPAYVLLSIAYEPWFFAALAAALLTWMLVETHLAASSASISASLSHGAPAPPVRLRWADVRFAVVWLAFNNMAFFGTGDGPKVIRDSLLLFILFGPSTREDALSPDAVALTMGRYPHHATAVRVLSSLTYAILNPRS